MKHIKYLHTYLIEHKYERDPQWERTCVMGGAYERYPLEKIWAYQELEETEDSEKTYSHV